MADNDPRWDWRFLFTGERPSFCAREHKVRVRHALAIKRPICRPKFMFVFVESPKEMKNESTLDPVEISTMCIH